MAKDESEGEQVSDARKKEDLSEEEKEAEKAQREAEERAKEEASEEEIEQSEEREGDAVEQNNPDFPENAKQRRN